MLGVEAQARYDYRWTDGLLRPKFREERLLSSPRAAGLFCENIEFENSFGAWIRQSYQCDFNVAAGTAVDMRVQRGRLR